MGRLASPTFRARRLVLVFVALFGAWFVAEPAGAQSGGFQPCSDEDGCVLALGVTGLIDPILTDFMVDAIRDAQHTEGYLAVVVVLDSEGSVVDQTTLASLVETMRSSSVPVSVWIGPSGASARGGAAELALAAPSFSMAPGASIGDVGTGVLGDPAVERQLDAHPAARVSMLSATAAKKTHVVERVDPLLGDHVLAIDGVPSKTVRDSAGRPKREMVALGLNVKPSLGVQLFHTAASPSVAYLLFAVAVGLLLFEFFTAGVGIAGVVGAVCGLLAAAGAGAPPLRPWALVLCLFAAFGFAIDVQTAIPRAWTIIGLVSWTVGSLFLFDGFRPGWLALVTGVGGMAVTMVSGMPSMVRSRFGTPTLGRTWMMGKVGRAVTALAPEGVVTVDGGEWRGITNRATPIDVGDELRVVGIDGMVLEVEPLEGGAVDYREQRRARGASARDD